VRENIRKDPAKRFDTAAQDPSSFHSSEGKAAAFSLPFREKEEKAPDALSHQ